jgi:hypothetical protein
MKENQSMNRDDLKKFVIRFQDEKPADAGIKVKALRKDLLEKSRDVQVGIRKDDSTTQDFGTTLVLVLGTSAVTAIAKGIADYLRRNRGRIVIEADGKVIAENISGEDAARIAEAMSAHHR